MRVGEILKEQIGGVYPVFCQIVPMGQDYTICVWGGDTPHVGSVVMSVARSSLTGEGTGVTSVSYTHLQLHCQRNAASAADSYYNSSH